MRFTKMHGAGNDYVFVDCFHHPVPLHPDKIARETADRHKGIGSDGLILIHPSGVADARMQMFNADGSEGEMCGNGIRCVAKYLYDHGICRKTAIKIETGAGILALELTLENAKVRLVRVDMGPPRFQPGEIPTLLPGRPELENRVIEVPLEVGNQIFHVNCISMGNPHCVIFVEKATDDLVLNTGPLIERHPSFPARVNVEFVEVISPTEVRQRTWERGSGETQACGTGASAVCVAGVLSGRTERTIVNQLLGGTLTLEWDPVTNHVFKTGSACEVFEGVWNPNHGH
jgi:diaminopimelate epimerase